MTAGPRRFFQAMVRGGLLGTALSLFLGSGRAADSTQPLSHAQRQTLDAGLRALNESLARVHDRPSGDQADAAIFQKGLIWALRYDREFSAADVRLLEQAITRGRQRATMLAAGTKPWKSRKGKLALGYVSRIDGSVQPYGLIVPKNYDSAKPHRLDVVLHGSTRPVGMSELRFIARFDEGDRDSTAAPDQPFLELHPLGRVENCYRWAGEDDVFEAIEDVCRRYTVDRDRIVLRGMSMGGSGTWHLGLKHPDRFVALGPYAGYVDTHRFSETPFPRFVKVGPLPEHQELGLHMLDSIDYAANAGVVPAVACMGEKDVFFQAHVLMAEAMRRERLTMVNLIASGTGHVIDPATHAEQMRRIGEYVAKGLNHQPREIRFVTWTLKYSRCHWLQVLGLTRHYARAELSARWRGDAIDVDEPQNITRFAILTSQLPSKPKTVRVGATELALPDAVAAGSQGIVFARRGSAWRVAGALGHVSLEGKRPGLQGPIDDAFTAPFLCVRGTGRPWNPAIQAYAIASLARFEGEWNHYFRGDLPIKDDTAVTDKDVRTRNLILFGDPGSNHWIAKVLPRLPLSWTQDSLRMPSSAIARRIEGDSSAAAREAGPETPRGTRDLQEYPAANHLPALIAPNPLPGAGEHYVVLNSGHTFRESELSTLNYLLFPRWGDWAVLQIDPGHASPAPLQVTILRAGYFDEQWQFPGAPARSVATRSR